MMIRAALCLAPFSLVAACSSAGGSIKDVPVGSFPSDANLVEVWTDMAELAEPGLEHEVLKHRVGEWDISIRSRDGTSDRWREDKGTSTVRMALDDRYLVEEVHGTINGRPFKGYQLVGYSRLEGEYLSVWLDTHSTWPLVVRGERGEDGVLRMSGRLRDVVTPAGRPFHVEETPVTEDELLREVYDTIDGQPVKVLEIRRTRRR